MADYPQWMAIFSDMTLYTSSSKLLCHIKSLFFMCKRVVSTGLQISHWTWNHELWIICNQFWLYLQNERSKSQVTNQLTSIIIHEAGFPLTALGHTEEHLGPVGLTVLPNTSLLLKPPDVTFTALDAGSKPTVPEGDATAIFLISARELGLPYFYVWIWNSKRKNWCTENDIINIYSRAKVVWHILPTFT